jgi:hypothetical protein
VNLEVWIFEWPSRFLVEATSPDREWEKLFKVPDPDPLAPYLVELDSDDLPNGWCGCRDFWCNVWFNPNRDRVTCKHIDAARLYRSQFTEQPKTLPKQLNL